MHGFILVFSLIHYPFSQEAQLNQKICFLIREYKIFISCIDKNVKKNIMNILYVP